MSETTDDKYKLYSVDLNMIMFAFRYALGKPYNIAELCVRWLSFLWSEIPEAGRDQIKREIMLMIERGEAGDRNAVSVWLNLHDKK